MVKRISILLANEGKEHAFFPLCQGRSMRVGIGNSRKVVHLFVSQQSPGRIDNTPVTSLKPTMLKCRLRLNLVRNSKTLNIPARLQVLRGEKSPQRVIPARLCCGADFFGYGKGEGNV